MRLNLDQHKGYIFLQNFECQFFFVWMLKKYGESKTCWNQSCLSWFCNKYRVIGFGFWIFWQIRKYGKGKRKVGYWVNHGLGLLNVGKRVFRFG